MLRLLPSMRRMAELAFVTLCLTLPLTVSFCGQHDDLEMYGTWAKRISQHVLPYRNFDVEYPPLATLSIVLPGLVTTGRAGFATSFVICMALWDAAGKWGMSQSLPKALRQHFWLVASALGLVLNYTLLRRFDPAAVCCTALGLSGCVRRPSRLAPFVWLGLGAAIKLYPIVLVPGALLFAWFQHRRSLFSLMQALSLSLAFGLPCFFTFYLYGPPSFNWVHFHHERGLHVASSLVAWPILWRGGPGLVLEPEFAYGCTQIVGDFSEKLTRLSPGLTILALGATFVAMCPGLKTPAGLWRTSTALLCALLLTAKVFSPQYMGWLVGVGAMASAYSRRLSPTLVASLGLAALATAQLYPNEARIYMGRPSAQYWLLVRTLALGVLWGNLARPWHHWRRTDSTRRVIDKQPVNRQVPLYEK